MLSSGRHDASRFQFDAESHIHDLDHRRSRFHSLASDHKGNLKRSEQAAVTVIQTTQSDRWWRALDLLGKLPENGQISDSSQWGRE